MIIHKQKIIKPKSQMQLLNADGSWNIECGQRASSIRASESWDNVTCKNCLTHKGDE
jgi:hypothetical protein